MTEMKIAVEGTGHHTLSRPESCTFICSRDTLDPSLMLAINSRRQGMDATVFYTFMGMQVPSEKL